MTGIERLRRMARSQNMDNAWTAMLAHELCDIADQIERDARDAVEIRKDAERALCVELDAPIDEGADPLDVLRRHVGCLSDTIENLRLELGEARDEAAWAESLSGILDGWADLLGFPEQKGDPGKITARVGAVLDGTWRRLMPEGMEWPRYEDGEPVRIGEDVDTRRGICTIKSVRLYDGSFTLYGEDKHGLFEVCHISWQDGERVRRPAPKVLDADGVEIRVGDTVYHVKDGSEMTVYGIEGEWLIVSVGGRIRHDIVTHRAPVFAADGKPLREGETVYDIEDKKGYPHTVASTGLDGLGHVKTTCEEPTPSSVSIHPSRLTHERSDSWERIEADCMQDAKDYCEEHGIEPEYPKHIGKAKCEDLVRRARALAGGA